MDVPEEKGMYAFCESGDLVVDKEVGEVGEVDLAGGAVCEEGEG